MNGKTAKLMRKACYPPTRTNVNKVKALWRKMSDNDRGKLRTMVRDSILNASNQ